MAAHHSLFLFLGGGPWQDQVATHCAETEGSVLQQQGNANVEMGIVGHFVR